MQREHERAPCSPADLFTLALNHLDDIKDQLEKGPFSNRGLFKPETSEEAIQKWLADKLEASARSRYVVSREKEVDKRKRPDIRLDNPTISGSVSIEIKPLDKNYSLPDLESALTDQLLGLYIRDARSRHGILVLTYAGSKKHWEVPDTNDRVDFAALTDHLARALRLEKEDPRVDGLRVVALDFTTAASQP